MVDHEVVWNNKEMSTDPATPVTMAELEQTDPAFAAQVRRARRRQDADSIMNLARTAQAAASVPKTPKRAPEPETGPEPIWR